MVRLTWLWLSVSITTRGCNALHEQQRSAFVTQVVKAHRWKVGSLKELVKPVRDVRTVGERAPLARED
jgi:hypothetical protein